MPARLVVTLLSLLVFTAGPAGAQCTPGTEGCPGPGAPTFAEFDLDGDGKQEIMAATSSRLVVALDWQCDKQWAVRMNAAANVLACVRSEGKANAEIVLGCGDGHVRVLNEAGSLVRMGTIDGQPTVICQPTHQAGNRFVAIGTSAGELSLFEVPR